jgi:UDP-2,3-diacylglucosamine pyrophosphatase LpxH
MTKRARKEGRITLVSDLHAGSRFAPVPPQYRLHGADHVDAAHTIQAHLYDCWTHFVETCEPAEELILNGDLFDGEDVKDRGQGVIFSSLHQQGRLAEEMLKPLCKKHDRVRVIRGTQYHEPVEVIESLARNLGAEQHSPGKYSSEIWEWEFHGLRFHATHHTSMWIYQAGAADREALMQNAAEGEGKIDKSDVLIRSHVHTKRIMRGRGKWIIVTPCWKALNTYAVKKLGSARAIEALDIGALQLVVHDAGRIEFIEYDYQLYKTGA